MNTFSILWSKALEILRERLEDKNDKISFSTWIKELKPCFVEDDFYYLETSNSVSKDMLTVRFSDDIQDAMDEAQLQTPGAVFTARFPKFLTPQEIERLQFSTSTGMSKNDGNITLNPTFTFDTFVRGGSNEYAYAIAKNISKNPGTQINNPLFIYGGVGLGKTHLINAIGNEIVSNDPNAKVLFISSETFTNELIECLQTKNAVAFRNKFRTVDVLLIDDIQFIANKPSTQEEFFHTFNTLKEVGKQIVISSDKPPYEIPRLEERLVSRFRSGVSVEISKPEYETRVAILRSKIPFLLEMTGSNIVIPDSVIDYIASKENTNIRDLEGAIKCIVNYASLSLNDNSVETVDLEMAKKVLKGFFAEPQAKIILPQHVIKTVSEYFGISEADLLSKKKSNDIAKPRQVAMYIMRSQLNLTYGDIGNLFGGKDHSTVSYAETKIKKQLTTDQNFKNIMDDIIYKLKE